MLQDADKIKLESNIDKMLTLKSEIKTKEEELERLKDSTLNFLNEKGMDRYKCLSGMLKIISFSRQSLIKDEVLDTFSKINGEELDHIDITKHIKSSDVEFLLVKGQE